MIRLIDAEALKKDIAENSITLEETWAIEVECVKALIDLAPTIEERPHGKWKYVIQDINKIGYFACPFCGHNALITPTNFCSNCGADLWRTGDDKTN